MVCMLQVCAGLQALCVCVHCLQSNCNTVHKGSALQHTATSVSQVQRELALRGALTQDWYVAIHTLGYTM